jgi:hypothetical protein
MGHTRWRGRWHVVTRLHRRLTETTPIHAVALPILAVATQPPISPPEALNCEAFYSCRLPRHHQGRAPAGHDAPPPTTAGPRGPAATCG